MPGRLSTNAMTAIAVVVCTHVSWAQSPALPQTPAGKIARAYLEAFDSGDSARMQAFEQAWRAPSAMKRTPMAERLTRYRESSALYGRLNVKRIVNSTDTDLVLAVQASTTSDLLYVVLELQQTAPHKLAGVRFEGPLDPKRIGRFEKPIDGATRERVVTRASEELQRAYIFEDVAQRMVADLRARMAGGEYDAIDNVFAFARQLTTDLRAISNDKHLRVRPRVPRLRGADRAQRSGPRPAGADNFGFVRAETLPGNVGYIKLNGFAGHPDGRAAAAAAMAFVERTAALVFDLRENGGGSPDMIVFLSGYLFDSPVHLNSFHNRSEGTVRDTHSAAEVHGLRYGQDKPVFVLTSSYTFSAAEEFTYNLKHLKRATIVGETTGGGAHPVRGYDINHLFSMSVPYARAVNPVTKTNWEGVGVIPHHSVPADQALDAAHRLALGALQPDNAASGAAQPSGSR